jgi:hypothetical protein
MARARNAVQPISTKIEREARLRWVPISKMKVAPSVTQRMKLNRARVDRIATEFDPEQIGTPTVAYDGEAYWIIDGWHRIEALKTVGWGDQQIQCWTYEGLTDEEMAEKFLKLNDTLTVDAFSLFRVAITAGRGAECDIDRIVRALGLRISREKGTGSIRSVGALRKVHARGDATLARSLKLIRDAWGDSGFEAPVIDGIGLLCHRYNGELDFDFAVQKLGDTHGGVNGVLNRAEVLRRQTGNQKAQCVAAAAVEIINAGRGTKKLAPWWRA